MRFIPCTLRNTEREGAMWNVHVSTWSNAMTAFNGPKSQNILINFISDSLIRKYHYQQDGQTNICKIILGMNKLYKMSTSIDTRDRGQPLGQTKETSYTWSFLKKEDIIFSVIVISSAPPEEEKLESRVFTLHTKLNETFVISLIFSRRQ